MVNVFRDRSPPPDQCVHPMLSFSNQIRIAISLARKVVGVDWRFSHESRMNRLDCARTDSSQRDKAACDTRSMSDYSKPAASS